MKNRIYAGSAKTTVKDYFMQFAVIGAVVLLLTILFPMKDFFGERVVTIYSLDINPSIVLKVDRNDNVLIVNKLNDEANNLMAGIDYQERNLEEVFSDIIEKAIKSGYINNQRKNYVLLSKLTNAEEKTGQENILIDLIYHKIADLIDGEAAVYFYSGQKEIFAEAKDRQKTPGMVLLLADLEKRGIQLSASFADEQYPLQEIVKLDDEQPNYISQIVGLEGMIKAVSASTVQRGNYKNYYLEHNDQHYKLDLSQINQDLKSYLIESPIAYVEGRYNSSQGVLQATDIQPTSTPATNSSIDVFDHNRRVAVVKVNFNNANFGFSANQLRGLFFTNNNSVNNWYRQASYGQVNFSGNVYGPITVPYSNYGTFRQWDYVQAIKERASSIGLNLDNYHHVALMLPNHSGASWGGIGQVSCLTPPCFTWVQLRDINNEWLYVVTHELGHNLGMYHATTPNDEYGDRSCPMGRSFTMFNGPHTNNMGWLDRYSGAVQTVNSSGTYTISSLATNPSSTSNPQVLQIPIPGSNNYYAVSYRQNIGRDAGLNSSYATGASIHRSPAKSGFIRYHDSTVLLRTLSSSNSSWSDGSSGITVRQVSRTASSVTVSVTTTSTETRTLNVRSNGANDVRISASPNNYGGTTNYTINNITDGQKITLVAAENADGKEFINWTGSGCSSSNRRIEVTMSSNRMCTANYEKVEASTYNLTVRSSGASDVSIIGDPSRFGQRTNYQVTGIRSGTSISLRAPATSGTATFTGWSGTGCTSSNRTINVSMTTNRTCTANYETETTWLLSVNSSGASNVAISASPSRYGGSTFYRNTNISHGTRISLTAPATSGNATFTGWSGTGCSSSSRTINVLMTANRSCTANYGQVSTRNHTLSVRSSGVSGVNVTASPSTYSGQTNYTRTNISDGTQINLTAPQRVGNYVFSNWSGTGCVSSSRTIPLNLTRDVSCTANYVKEETENYTLSVRSTGASNVTITTSPSSYGGRTNYAKTVSRGTQISITAPQRVGEYEFVNWSGSYCRSSSRTIPVRLNQNVSCVANYEKRSDNTGSSEISLLTYVNNTKYTSSSTINVSRGSRVDFSWQSDTDIPTNCQLTGLINRSAGTLGWDTINNIQMSGYLQIRCQNSRGTITRQFLFQTN